MGTHDKVSTTPRPAIQMEIVETVVSDGQPIIEINASSKLKLQ